MHVTHSDTTPPSVSVNQLTLSAGNTVVLENADLELPQGQWTCLLGQSGSGKTTLLKYLCGLIPTPDVSDNTTTSNGRPVSTQVVWMAQRDLLLPWMTVLDNVLLGCRLRGDSKVLQREQNDKAKVLLDRVGLGSNLTQFPGELSGGMRQRVALARTLMQDKSVCLLDEPFANVDAITRHKLQALAHELLCEHTVLLVTHDPLEAIRCGHRLYVLSRRQRQVLPPISVPGVPLRAVDAPEVAALQAQLLDELAAG